VLLIFPRLVYLIACVSSLYLALVPFLSGGHGSNLFSVFWIGAGLLLMAAIFPGGKYSYIDLTIRDSYRVVSPANMFALVGSTLITALFFYQIARFGALRFAFVRLVAAPYQPTTFYRVSQIIMKPVLITLLISSLASLVISAVITLRMRNRTDSPPLDAGNR
jgi:hypothetical protein